MQVFATLGLYLILAFVLPGFCYLLVFALCFPDAYQTVRKFLPPEEKDTAQGTWMAAAAVIGGLLLSSGTFALEIVLRCISHTFAEWYPKINFGGVPHGSESYASVLVPSAIMHLNIGSGTLILLIIYLFYTSYRGEWKKQNNGGATVVAASKIWLTIALIVVVPANLLVASELFHRINDLTK
jgi:hypothetical protein